MADDWHYPVGADTPSAPWNEVETVYIDCPDCNGTGKFCTYAPPEGEAEYDECETCEGEGCVVDEGPEEPEPDHHA